MDLALKGISSSQPKVVWEKSNKGATACKNEKKEYYELTKKINVCKRASSISISTINK